MGEPSPCEYHLTPNIGDANRAYPSARGSQRAGERLNFTTFGNSDRQSRWMIIRPGPICCSARSTSIGTYGFLEVPDAGSQTALEGLYELWKQVQAQPDVVDAPGEQRPTCSRRPLRVVRRSQPLPRFRQPRLHRAKFQYAGKQLRHDVATLGVVDVRSGPKTTRRSEAAKTSFSAVWGYS